MLNFCPDPELLAAYAERRLDEAAEEKLRTHAADCDGCRRELALLHDRMVGEAPDAVPADAQARLRTAILRALGSTRRHRARRATWWRSAGLAAAALVAFAGVALFVHERSKRPMRRNETASNPTPGIREERPTSVAVRETPLPTPAPAPAPAPNPVKEPETTSPPVVERHETAAATEPSPAPAPKAGATEPAPRRTFARIRKKHSPVTITDPVGNLSVRRKGQADPEHVTGSVEVGDGDTLVASGRAGFHLAGTEGVVLEKDTEVSLSKIEEDRSTWLSLHRGTAIVGSATAGCWIDNGTRTVAVDPVRATFSAGTEGKSLRLLPMDGFLACRDESGEPFYVEPGSAAVLDLQGSRTEEVPVEMQERLQGTYLSTHPKELTLLHFPFDPDERKADLFGIPAGVHSRERSGKRYNYFVQGTEKRRQATVKVDLRAASFVIGRDLLLRFRARTNADRILLEAPVDGKFASVACEIAIDLPQRNRWILLEAPLRSFEPSPSERPVTLHFERDTFSFVQFRILTDDVPEGDRPLLWIDDLQILERE